MVRDQLVKVLAWRLGNRKDMEERIIAEMDLAQEVTLEQHTWRPWFLAKDLEGVSLTAGDSSFALPADFLDEVEDAVLWLVEPETGGYIECHKEGVEDLRRFIPTAENPYAYAVDKGFVKLSQAVPAALNVSWQYMAKDALMSAANVETLWLKHAPDLVLAVLGAEIAGKHLQNPNLAGAFQADMGQAWQRLQALDTAKKELNQQRTMGRVG